MKNNDKATRTYAVLAPENTEGGPGSAGQSGDTQGLSDTAEAGSESVLELVEEGQNFEAVVLMGIEDAPDADVAEVHTKQIREDVVPPEYVERDND